MDYKIVKIKGEKKRFVKIGLRKRRDRTKEGLKVRDGSIVINDRKFKPSRRMDVFVNKEEGMIMVIKGNTYKVALIRGSKSFQEHYSFSSVKVRKAGLKKGNYKRIRQNTYVFDSPLEARKGWKKKKHTVVEEVQEEVREEARPAEMSEEMRSAVMRSAVMTREGNIDYPRLKKFLTRN